MFLQMHHFCFPDLGKEKLCSILEFGNACFNIIVRINHDNVASRGAVGCTHTIVRFQTRIRRNDGTENFGGFVYVLHGFPQRDFVLWVFLCQINISLFCDHLYCTGYHAQGYHAFSTTARLPRLCIYIYPGYHAILLSSIPRLSHLSYHAPPHTYIGLSHPP